MNTNDYARELADKLTPEQKERAFNIAAELGWGSTSRAPPDVWIDIFRYVAKPTHSNEIPALSAERLG